MINLGIPQFFRNAMQFSRLFGASELRRCDLEKVIEEARDLKRVTIAPDTEVHDLDFTNVKMDKITLSFLIKKGADLQGVDLSDQDLSGMDFTNVDLSGALCTRTNFSGTTLIRTNLTGVDLSTALFDTHTVNQIDSAIVSYEDRFPYIKNLQKKLLYILSDEVCENDEEDAFYSLLEEEREILYEEIVFDLQEDFLRTGQKESGGAQGICLNDAFDLRQINGTDQIMEHKKFAEDRLLGDTFTVAQKALFHYTRSAIWVLINLDCNIFEKNQLDQIHTTHHFHPDLLRIKALQKIYLGGPNNQQRVSPLLTKMCCDAILPIIQQKYPEISATQVDNVVDLLSSPYYCW